MPDEEELSVEQHLEQADAFASAMNDGTPHSMTELQYFASMSAHHTLKAQIMMMKEERARHV
jgi:hypothetical protein